MQRRDDNRITYWVHIATSCLILSFVSACSSPPPPPTTTLVVRSTPDEAHIMINGIDYGQTPATISDLMPGEHYVILQKEEHKRLNQRITLEAEIPLELDLELMHHAGYVTFTTKPNSAQVYIDSPEGRELIGETPLNNALLNTGTYFFEILLENHHPTEGELVVENGDYYTEEHRLEPMIAQVQIFSRPTGAQVWIDDEQRPEMTPANITLPPGEYNIGVYIPGYMMNEQLLQMEPNGTYNLNALLKEGDMPLGMVLVPAGEFIFGDDNKSPDEKPLKKVTLDAFYIDKYEVTNAEFQKVFPSHTFPERRDNYPVRGVTWKQASDFAAAVGKRLPTETEWEKASRGASGREYPWGAVFRKGLANIEAGVNSDTQIVGNHKKGVSEYGSFDMSGNVYEWVNDWYNPYPGNPEVTVNYGTVYKVLRGGSFMSDVFEVRSAKRHYDKPDAQREDYGFRCAQDLKP